MKTNILYIFSNRKLIAIGLLVFSLFTTELQMVLAQVTVKNSKLIPVYSENVEMLVLGKNGVIYFGKEKDKTFKINQLNTKFEPIDSWVISKKEAGTYINSYYDSIRNIAYIICKISKKKLNLVEINLKTKAIRTFGLLFNEKIKFDDMVFSQEKIYFICTSKDLPSIYEAGAHNPSNFTEVKLPLGHENIWPYRLSYLGNEQFCLYYSFKKNGTYYHEVAIFDSKNNLLDNDLIGNTDSKLLVNFYFRSLIRLADKDYIITGLVDVENNKKVLVFLRITDGNNQVYNKLKLYDQFYSPRYDITLHQVSLNKNGILVAFEFQYPVYYPPPKDRVLEVFAGYYKVRTVLSYIDLDGDEILTQGIGLHSTPRTMKLKNISSIVVKDSSILHFYFGYNKLRTSEIYLDDPETQDTGVLTYFKFPVKKGDALTAEVMTNNWFGNNMVAMTKYSEIPAPVPFTPFVTKYYILFSKLEIE